MSSLRTGQVLEDRFEVEAVIATGGMSTVYRCLDRRLGRRVAAKVMNESYRHDPLFRQRFRREARAMAQLTHPCLVGVYDFSSEGEHVFLVMELITGGTLRELLAERGPMPASMAASVMRSVLTGLAVAHEAQLVHRDIKPDNVLIHGNHQVKLSDFGLVRAASVAQANPNHILGTVSYLSPEQVTGADITPASDVYSAGVLFYELLTGQVPFHGETPLAHAYARLESDVPAPSSMSPQVPKLFDELVATACAKNPAERFMDAGEFLAALDDVVRELGLPDSRVPIPNNAAAHRASELIVAPTDPATEMFTSVIPRAQDDATTVIPVAADHPAVNGPENETSVLGSVDETSIIAPETTAVPPVAAQPPAPTGVGMPQETAMFAPPAAAPPVPTSAAAAAFAPPAATAPVPVKQNVAVQPTVSNSSRAGFIIWLIIVLAITAAVAVGGWWFGSGRYGEIPQVVGMDTTAATYELSAAGFDAATSDVYHDTVPIGHVVETSPTAGQREVKGDAVTLFVSLGMPQVPELSAGFDEEATARTFTLSDGPGLYSDTVPVGGVVSVRPSPGTTLPVGSPLTVSRSMGPAPVTVPTVLGQSVEDAHTTLSNLGLTVTTHYGFSEQADADVAYATAPAAGTQIPKGSAITLKVSTAKTVPNVAGLTESEARQLLADRGIQVAGVEISTNDRAVGRSPDEVLESSPAAGSRIDGAHTGVTIVLVGRLQVPNVIGMPLARARDTLNEVGLKTKVVGSADSEATVYWQNPSLLSNVDHGAEITLRTIN